MGRVGLVLGAGGPVGHAFHSGVLSALADAGWDARGADLIVGTSIGSATGGLLRAGMPPADLYARVRGEPLSEEGASILERSGGWPTFPTEVGDGRARLGAPSAPSLLLEMARHPRRVRAGLLLAAMMPAGAVPTTGIRESFGRLFGSAWPARALWTCSVDLDTGRRVVFGKPGAPETDVGTAVAASCAVPSFFAPVEIGGRRYVDGGAHSPANTDLLEEAGHLDAAVVLMPMGLAGWPRRAGVDLPGRAINQLTAELGLEGTRRAGVPVLMFAPGPEELELMHYNSFDLRHRPEIALRARRAAARRLSSGLAAILSRPEGTEVPSERKGTEPATSRAPGAGVARRGSGAGVVGSRIAQGA